MNNKVFREGRRAGEHLLSEVGDISREEVMLAAGPALPAGQILALGKSGEYAPFQNGGADGLGTALAVLYAPKPESDKPRPATVHARLCEMIGECLTGLDAKSRADLQKLDILVR